MSRLSSVIFCRKGRTMSDPHEYEVTPGLPEGKLVLVIDDDKNFRQLCIGKLRRALTERAPEEKDLKLLPAGSLEKFQAILKMLEADSRKGDLVYALVDLKLPATERREEPNQAPATENGRDVCRALREWNVLHLLVSGAGRSDIDEVVIPDQMDFRSKDDFNDQETVKEIAERDPLRQTQDTDHQPGLLRRHRFSGRRTGADEAPSPGLQVFVDAKSAQPHPWQGGSRGGLGPVPR